MKKCSKCGFEGESKFCPECGTEMEEIVEVTEDDEKANNKKKVDIKIIVIAVLSVAIIALAVIAFFKPGGDHSGNAGSTIDNTQNNGDMPETKNEMLPGGKYVIGTDFPAGKYMFKYSTTLSEEDYWGLDYIYILRASSKGENETIGGEKYDERIGGAEYEEIKSGKSFYVRLEEGDTITVETEEGSWMY